MTLPLKIFMILAVLPEKRGYFYPPGQDPGLILTIFPVRDPPRSGEVPVESLSTWASPYSTGQVPSVRGRNVSRTGPVGAGKGRVWVESLTEPGKPSLERIERRKTCRDLGYF